MAIVTRRVAACSDAQGACTLDLTVDSATHFVTQAILVNGMASDATLTVRRNSDDQVLLTYVVHPGANLTQPIPANAVQDPRANFPQPGPYAFALS